VHSRTFFRRRFARWSNSRPCGEHDGYRQQGRGERQGTARGSPTGTREESGTDRHE